MTKALALQQIPAVGGLHAAISHKFVSVFTGLLEKLKWESWTRKMKPG